MTLHLLAPPPAVLLAGAVIGLAAVAGATLVMALTARVLPQGRARELVGFLPNCVVLLGRLRNDRRLSRRARLALGAALAYIASPVQLIPNFIPVIGQTDDIVVVTAALRYACRRLPSTDVDALWPGDPAYLDRLLARAKPILEVAPLAAVPTCEPEGDRRVTVA